MFSVSLEGLTIFGLIYILPELLALAMAVHAILHTRTSQGAIAWALSLVSTPLIALPLYAFFGRRKFAGYVQDIRIIHREVQQQTDQRFESQWQSFNGAQRERKAFTRSLETLSGMGFTGGNDTRLLVNGEATFDAIFAAIDHARDYILLAFFIVHDDALGRDLQQRLIARQQAGVQVFFLYDSIGSYALPTSYIELLTGAGAQVRPFGEPGHFKNRFQLNFRNHRKIVVVDGMVGFAGGHNVGDEYLGKSDKFGPWRDTHIQLTGPAVLCLQTVFLEDWLWVTGETPELNWMPASEPRQSREVMIVPSGPADDLETCSLFFHQLITHAHGRIWISSPYFVPNEAVLEALKVAALRGVDVRVMIPENPDKKTVWYAAFAYMKDAQLVDDRFYRFTEGFLHQKVMLVDDDLAVVGTANLDNRSFRLNFEVSVLVTDAAFATEVENMLLADFRVCRPVTRNEVVNQSLPARVAIAGSRLLSPLL